MSEPPQSSFSLSVTNQDSLEELAWSLDAFKGEFRLILARCNYVNLRSQIVEQLQTDGIQILVLNKHETRLYSRIQAFGAAHHPEALMVLGIESLEHFDELITVANKVREDFQKDCPFPVVLWINDRLFAQMLRLAPDLESWATSITFEAIAPLEIAQFVTSTADRWFAGTLEFNRDQYLELARELEVAQLELRRSPDLLTAKLRADLQSLLGYTSKLQNQMAVALDCFKQALELWQETGNQARQLKIVDEIVACLYLPTFLSKEINSIRALESLKELSEFISPYLNLIEQVNKPELLVQSSLRMDGILEFLEEKQRFETLVQQGVKRHRSSNQWLSLARDYGFLAQIQLHRQKWQEANRFAQDALKVLEENFFKVKGTAAAQEHFSQRDLVQIQNDQDLYHFLVAEAQRGLGNLAAEIQYLEKAKGLDLPDNQPSLYLKVLSALQVAYRQDKQYLKAFEVKQTLQSLERQYGLRAFVGAGRVKPQKKAEVLQGLAGDLAEEDVAQEIAVSGRQLDVERLLARIGQPDYRLIVIHGFSGVGKSSLVEGGLVPALKTSSLAVEDCLPVTLRVYTNWLDELRQQLMEALRVRGVALDPPQPPLERGEQEEIQGENPTALVTGEEEKLVGQDPPQPPLERGEKEKIGEILGELRQWARNLQIVLIFDQFEEFFFVCTDRLQRRAFFEFLGDCLNILNVKVLFSLREDYLHYLLECNRLDSMKIIGNDILSKNVLYPLGNFSPEDAKTIIEQLTQQSSFRLEPSLVDQLVADLAGQLQEVRPIELQIVGAQLQAEKITTLEQYEASGKRQELVKRYLAGTVADCGEEHQQIAELVLYLLTDEQGTRPLKTRTEIETELKNLLAGAESDQEALDLVFEIFVGSGLVLLLPESPADRYQLVHDYLAEFIRKQQEPKLTALMAELEAERSKRIEVESEKEVLQSKVGLVTTLVVATATLGVVVVAGLWANNLSFFAKLEQNEVERNVIRVQEALTEEIDQLNVSAVDVGSWDDTYEYIAGTNPSYVQVNLVDQALAGLRINAIALLNQKMQVVFGTGFDLEEGVKTPLPEELKQQFVAGNSLVTHTNKKNKSTGILMLKNRAILLASQPILKTSGEGPARGTFLLGRYLDGDRIEALSKRTRVDLKFYSLENAQQEEQLATIIAELKDEPNETIKILRINRDTIHGYVLIRDLNDQPALLLKVMIPRTIYKQGQINFFSLAISLTGVGIMFGIAILLPLRSVLLRRVTSTVANNNFRV